LASKLGERLNSEYLGFKFVERGVFKVMKPEPGTRIHDTITRVTRLEYQEDNGVIMVTS
jgi:hypothetical protein